MSRIDEMKELIDLRRVRLHELEKRAALQGNSVDIAIPIEIEETKRVIANLQTELKELEKTDEGSSQKEPTKSQDSSQKSGMTIKHAIERYLKQIRRSKSQNTATAYSQGLQAFAASLADSEPAIDVVETDVSELSPRWIEIFLNDLQKQAVATERLYTTAVGGFYRYVAAQEWATLNLSTLDFEMSQRRSQGRRLHIFPEGKVEYLLEYMEKTVTRPPEKLAERLTLQRDTALLITLADTGLRVSEACRLRKKDIDWERKRAVIIGKGDKQAIVRFSERAIQHINNYLDTRSEQDQRQGRVEVLPIFARHDKKSGKRVLPMSARTAENIVADRVVEALGPGARGTITPHTFRHYFVTRAARQQDILLAQHLARHESITTTSGYTHLTDSEIDAAYAAVFDPISSETEAADEEKPPRSD